MAEPLWTRDEIAAATGGRMAGPAFAADGVSIDSRTLEAGDLFVALTGERDGHAFAPGALARGAAGILASAPVDGPAVTVPDTLVGLEAMAGAARDRAPKARRGAVTGSVGKTTVTQLVRAGLARAGRAHGSVKSYNNHIGVPLTLARMPRDTLRAVFEIGMNHAGEIAPLSRLVAPEAVAITNVEAVHVENFADGEAGVARAKAEIFEGLTVGGAAILNADNRWRQTLSAEAVRKGAVVRTFGAAPDADARLLETKALGDGLDVTARIDGAEVAYRLRPSARHWAPMSLCALLMMRALGVELETGLAAVTAFEPLEGRGATRTIRATDGAFILIDESYNASPVSVAAAITALGARKAGRRIVVLTDMLELGPDSPARHAELAKAVEAANIDLVFCAGPLMRSLWDALPQSRRGRWAPAAAELAPCLVKSVGPGDAVMVKGSRDSKAKLLAEALVALELGEEGE
jgi:UDP-N-acetylmuramoyl-tripeptide--D-alanyl-D-alanine ligase